ncbi:hypothetical protein [Nocardioides jensenii]|uniref:hypothetical protein n=1 Tax=Nocardioides jensenii TaxID=1843 RepID=UPI00082CFF2F|nr:hypothetical protein [Nocardioides jensenii]
MDASKPAVSDHERVMDPVARQLNAAFLAGLVLLVPVRGALGTTTYNALFYWFVGGVVVIVAYAFVLRASKVPQAVGTALTMSGVFAVAVVIALAIVGSLGDPGSDTTVSLMAGLPAAAVAAPLSTAMIGRTGEHAGGTAFGVVACVLGFTIAFSAGPSIGEQLDDARDDAADIKAFEDSGLSPYVPELDGMVPEYEGTTVRTSQGGGREVVGYNVRYEQESSSNWDAAYITLSVSHPQGPACEEIEGHLECREGDGYVVTERDGVADTVSAERDYVRLTAKLREGTGDVPDVEAIGEALASADEVEWDDVVDLRK